MVNEKRIPLIPDRSKLMELNNLSPKNNVKEHRRTNPTLFNLKMLLSTRTSSESDWAIERTLR